MSDELAAACWGCVVGLLVGWLSATWACGANTEPVLIAEIHNADREPGRAVQMPLAEVIENAEQGLPVTVVGVAGE